MSIIGENIRRIRGEQDLTQRELGLKLGHRGGSYISAIEHGSKHPSTETIGKIAAALGCTSGELTSRPA